MCKPSAHTEGLVFSTVFFEIHGLHSRSFQEYPVSLPILEVEEKVLVAAANGKQHLVGPKQPSQAEKQNSKNSVSAFF